MKSLKEIGALIKQDHSDYAGWDDEEELALLVQQARPDIYRKYDEPDTFFKSQSISFSQQSFTHRRATALEKYSQRKIDDLANFFDPRHGRFRTNWRLKKAQAHHELQKVVTDTQRLVIEQMTMIDDAIINGQKKQIEFDYFVKQNSLALIELQAKAILIEAATNIGLPLEQYVNLREAELQLMLRNREYNTQMQSEIYAHAQKTKIDLDAEHARSQLEIADFFHRKKIELDAEIKLAEAELRLGVVADYMQANQQMIIIQDLLDQIYMEIEDIQTSSHSDATKRRMIADREETITAFKAQKNKTSGKL